MNPSNGFISAFNDYTDSTESMVEQVIPIGGTLSNFYASWEAAPGGTKNVTLTVRKNGADTSVKCTITGAATSCSDTTNSVTFSAGDRISIGATSTDAPGGKKARWTARFV